MHTRVSQQQKPRQEHGAPEYCPRLAKKALAFATVLVLVHQSLMFICFQVMAAIQ